MSRWSDSESWIGKDLRREAFYFASQGEDLYGSVYAPSSAKPALGIVICNSWGFEGNQTSRIAHWVSYSLALSGGVGFYFHYPGFGDSYGSFEEVTIGRLARASIDALTEASRRYPDTRWILVGLMMGASVASLAADRAPGVEQLLLVQPALHPSKYFARLERASRRSIGRPAAEGFAYGYRLSSSLLESASMADAAVDAALSRFQGQGTIVRYAAPAEVQGAPERFEQICVPGAWRFGRQDTPELIRATSKRLRKDPGMSAR